MKYSKALNRIYNNLMQGEQYGSIDHYRNDYPGPEAGQPYFWYNLCYADITPSNQYFHWRSFGSSAIKPIRKELLWLITTIFQCTPEEFEKKYITKTDFNKLYSK